MKIKELIEVLKGFGDDNLTVMLFNTEETEYYDLDATDIQWQFKTHHHPRSAVDSRVPGFVGIGQP